MTSLDELLKSLNFDKGAAGYEFVKEAICLVDEYEGMCDMAEDIYPKMAKSHDMPGTRIDQIIRRTIVGAYDGPYNELAYKFCKVPADSGYPFNKDFIVGIWKYCIKNNISIE